MRLIDADALMTDCQLAQKQADRHGREFANAFYSDSGEISTEWWCVEDMIENAPTIEPQRMRGKGRWNVYYHGEENGKSIFSYSCNQCGYGAPYNFIGGVCEQKKWNFCPNCGADMRGTE